MLNQVILVGRVLEIDKQENEEVKIILGIEKLNSVSKESDELPILINAELGNATIQYINNGATLGIKARIESLDGILQIIAEKLTFINSNSN